MGSYQTGCVITCNQYIILCLFLGNSMELGSIYLLLMAETHLQCHVKVKWRTGVVALIRQVHPHQQGFILISLPRKPKPRCCSQFTVVGPLLSHPLCLMDSTGCLRFTSHCGDECWQTFHTVCGNLAASSCQNSLNIVSRFLTP